MIIRHKKDLFLLFCFQKKLYLCTIIEINENSNKMKIFRIALGLALFLPFSLTSCSSDEDEHTGINDLTRQSEISDEENAFIKVFKGNYWHVGDYVRVNADGTRDIGFDTNGTFNGHLMFQGGPVIPLFYVVNDSVARLYYSSLFIGDFYEDVPYVYDEEKGMLRFPTSPSALGLLAPELKVDSLANGKICVTGEIMPPMTLSAEAGAYNYFVLYRLTREYGDSITNEYQERP